MTAFFVQIVNPFPNDKFSTLPIFKFDENGRKFSKRVEKSVGKVENALD